MCQYTYNEFLQCGHRLIDVALYCEKTTWHAGMTGQLNPCLETEFRSALIKAAGPEHMKPDEALLVNNNMNFWIGMTGICKRCAKMEKVPLSVTFPTQFNRPLSSISSQAIAVQISLPEEEVAADGQASVEHPFVHLPNVSKSVYDLLGISQHYDGVTQSSCKLLFFPSKVFRYTKAKWSLDCFVNGTKTTDVPNAYFLLNGGLTLIDRRFIDNEIAKGVSLEHIYRTTFAHRGTDMDVFMRAAVKEERVPEPKSAREPTAKNVRNNAGNRVAKPKAPVGPKPRKLLNADADVVPPARRAASMANSVAANRIVQANQDFNGPGRVVSTAFAPASGTQFNASFAPGSPAIFLPALTENAGFDYNAVNDQLPTPSSSAFLGDERVNNFVADKSMGAPAHGVDVNHNNKFGIAAPYNFQQQQLDAGVLDSAIPGPASAPEVRREADLFGVGYGVDPQLGNVGLGLFNGDVHNNNNAFFGFGSAGLSQDAVAVEVRPAENSADAGPRDEFRPAYVMNFLPVAQDHIRQPNRPAEPQPMNNAEFADFDHFGGHAAVDDIRPAPLNAGNFDVGLHQLVAADGRDEADNFDQYNVFHDLLAAGNSGPQAQYNFGDDLNEFF